MTISADISLHHRAVLGSTMAYCETGRGDAPHVLFLHGNPTSSYIWRNIMPLVAPVGHCIAPDLIGYGQSGKPDIGYRFFDQADYLDALIDELGIASAYLVAQDWGTALAFHLAARRPQLVRGLAFMEFIRPDARLVGLPPARRRAGDVPEIPYAGRGRGDGPRQQCVRRTRAARLDPAHAQRGGDGRLPRAVCDAREPQADLDAAARTADRRRAGRCRAGAHGGACGARGIDLSEAAVRGHARGAGVTDLCCRIRQDAQALRSHSTRRRRALSAGGSSGDDRPFCGRLDRRRRGRLRAAPCRMRARRA
ncbi:alpha/beta fold hydrolase [Bradyrhizobium elkanii]|uniref:alpha/beta fold hydrolase n=1 Tax=Bradyrhizobium elkanii TaxID=29448 RepID=UPI0035168C14